MSSNTSPQQSVHLQASYAQQSTPVTSTPSSHLTSSASNTFPDSAQSYSSDAVKTEESDQSPDAPTTSSKGKNGATGPADGKAKRHVCQICQRGFTTGGHLQRHQRIHTGVKAFKCPFPGCETRTSRQDNLQQHYRTHLSPTLRRGSGSAARAAVAAAMEAAGLKSTSSRGPRKSKGSNGGTPSSSASANTGHMPSPYQTPTSQGGPGPYGQYMYDPNQFGGYPVHALPPPGMSMAHNQSATSSRVPSPVNGHSSGHSSVGSMPSAHHQQPYFSQPFQQPYPYGGHMQQQPYRYGGPAGMPPAYGGPHPHHGLYSPGMAADHPQQHMYSPMQTGFPTHSRESSYGVLTPGFGGGNPMANGYPPRTQTSTPLSQNHEDPRLSGGSDDRIYGRRPPSPGRRRTPPHDMLAQGVVDPSNMSAGRQQMQQGMQPSYAYQPHHISYAYGGPQGHQMGMPPSRGQTMGHRASISSLSEDGSGDGGSDGSGVKTQLE